MPTPDEREGLGAEKLKKSPQKGKTKERERFKVSLQASLDAKSLHGTLLAQGPSTFNYEALSDPEKLNATLDAIDYRNIGRLDVQKLEEYFGFLREMMLKGSIKIKDITDRIIPNTNYALVLAKDNEYCKKLSPAIKRYKEGTPFRRKYEALASAAPTAKKYYREHEMVFGMYMRFFGQRIDLNATSYLFDKDVGNIPSKESLKGAHPNALDVFFKPVRIENSIQEGPPVRAMSSGIVIAVGRNYSAKTEDSYTGEGLTIQGGNGVITFNPQTREYQYYSHFFKTHVEPGDFINAGDILGVGGNSGYGADKPRRGSHVHWEVHKDGKAIPSAQLHSIISGEKLKANRRASLDAKSLHGTLLAQGPSTGRGDTASDAPAFDYESFVQAPRIHQVTDVRAEFPYLEKVKAALDTIPWEDRRKFGPGEGKELDSIIRSNWSALKPDYDQYFLVVNNQKKYAALVYYNKKANQYFVVENLQFKLQEQGGVRLSDVCSGVKIHGDISDVGIDYKFAEILASQAIFNGVYGRHVIAHGKPAKRKAVPRPAPRPQPVAPVAPPQVPKPQASEGRVALPEQKPVKPFDDEDYKRNKEYIESRGISYRQEVLAFKGRTFRFNIYEKTSTWNKKFKSYVVLHDTENDAFDTGIHAIGEMGGRLVALENKGQRNLLGTNIDPNRIFKSGHEYYPIARTILGLLGDKGPIISLHNNRNIANILTASYKNIKIFKSADGKENPDNVVWISRSEPIDKMSPTTLAEIGFYQRSNMNVVYEYVPKPNGNDESLSNWAAENDRPYYNVEIENGEVTAQKRYLTTILTYHRDTF